MTNTLGARITQYRKRIGVTQDQLAERMGVSAQAVSKWENDISCPDISVLPQLADYFNTTIDELLRGQIEKKAQVLPVQQRKSIDQLILRIYVRESGGGTVKVNLPLGLLKVAVDIGMQMPQVSGKSSFLKNIDFDSIMKMAEVGVVGKIVEVNDVDGDYVEIFIE